MAVEAERLLAVFEARFTSLEKALTKARADSSKTFTSIEKDASKAENALATIGSRGVPGIDKASKAIGRTRFETANLAAQFNDIGVQLAGGQSPFLIAIQQGSQINQVLGGAGAAGAVSMLGGAFASLINPVSLATIGLITVGGAAIQYFSTLSSGGEEGEAALKAQADIIQRVAQRWGDAVPALREYADQLMRVREEGELQQGVQIASNAALDKVRAVLPQINAELSQFAGEAAGGGWGTALEGNATQLASSFDEVQASLDEVSQALENGEDATEELNSANTALTNLLNSGAIPAVGGMRAALSGLADAYRSASEAAQTLNRQTAIADAAEANKGRFDKTGQRLGADGNPLSNSEFMSRFGYDDYFDFPTEKKPTRNKAAEEAQRERDSVLDLIENLQFERSAVGMTAVEKEKANALRRAGAAATDEEAQQIMTLVEATYTQREALKNQEDAYKQLQKAGETAINGLVTAMADGKIEAKELLSILLSVASQLLNSRGGGGGLGGLVSAIFGGGGGLPKFAGGTNFAPGGMAIVGEKGPELVNLPRGSQVVPNNRLGGGGIDYRPSYAIDARGAQRGVAEEITTALARYDKGRLARLSSDIPNLRKRGVLA